MAKEDTKVLVLQIEGQSPPASLSAFTNALQNYAQVQTENFSLASADSVNWETFIQEHSRPTLLLVPPELSSLLAALPEATLKGVRVLCYPAADSKKAPTDKLGALFAPGTVSTEDLDRIAAICVAPLERSGLEYFANKGEFLITHRIQDLEDIGWIVDVIAHFYRNSFGQEFQRSFDLRIALNLALEIGLGQKSDAVLALELIPTQKNILASIRYDLNSDSFQTSDESRFAGISKWSELVAHSDFLQVITSPTQKQVELRFLVGSGDGMGACYQTLLNPEAENKKLSPTGNAVFRRIETLIDELPDEKQLGVGPLGMRRKDLIATDPGSEENALAKLIGKKNQMVTQLTQRVEQEQQIAQERHKKIAELLTETKTSLETNRRELGQAKSRIKQLEGELSIHKSKSDNDKSEDTEKALAEINNSLRSANAEKATQEERLEMAEKKIVLLEKKYAKSLQELKAKEVELSETRPIILKLTKELEAAQAQLKLQSSQVPIQVSNEEYDKKIKALSAKIYEYQQKEVELQTNLKKVNLKLEQQEIGRKSSKDQVDGKTKTLERQVEQMKLKEKEFLKKIEELANALKKAKSGKAA